MQGSSGNRESSKKSKFESRGGAGGLLCGRTGRAFVSSQKVATFLILEFASDDHTTKSLCSLTDFVFLILFMRGHHRYARERAAEEPLGQASADPAKPIAPEFPAKTSAAANSPRRNQTPREIEVNSSGDTYEHGVLLASRKSKREQRCTADHMAACESWIYLTASSGAWSSDPCIFTTYYADYLTPLFEQAPLVETQPTSGESTAATAVTPSPALTKTPAKR